MFSTCAFQRCMIVTACIISEACVIVIVGIGDGDDRSYHAGDQRECSIGRNVKMDRSEPLPIPLMIRAR